MADKKWNEELRQKMSEYGQTPPEGLWEALEASGIAGGAQRAGKAAGAGLLSRLLGGRMAPAWYALAGVAAAVAAVLVLRTPGATSIPTPGQASEAIVQPTEDAPLALADDIQPASEPAGPGAVAPSWPAPAPAAPDSSRQPAADTAGATEPSRTASSGLSVSSPSDTLSSRTDSSLSSREEAQPQPGDLPSKSEPTPADDQAVSPAPSSPVVPLTRSSKRDRPLFAASFVGGGMPGGNASLTSTEYGMPSSGGEKMASVSMRQMSLISRNRIVQTIVDQKIDYQAGLLFTLSLTWHWGIETGVQLTRLTSRSSSTSGNLASVTDESFKYVGIPLRVVYTPVSGKFLSAYLSAGPELEYGLDRVWSSYTAIGSLVTPSDNGNERMGDFVLSGSLNAGVQLQPFKHGAFFVQPGLVVRHAQKKWPASYYTDHPVSFRLAAGYRLLF